MKRITKAAIAVAASGAVLVGVAGVASSTSPAAVTAPRDGEESYTTVNPSITIGAGQRQTNYVGCDQRPSGITRDIATSTGFLAGSSSDLVLRQNFPAISGTSGPHQWAVELENTGASPISVVLYAVCLDVDGDHF